MSSFEQGSHSFIVRIWWEPREIEGASAEWRGLIEHVASGKQHYCQDLEEIIAFIIPYLQEMDAKLNTSWWLRQWLWWHKRFGRTHDESSNRQTG